MNQIRYNGPLSAQLNALLMKKKKKSFSHETDMRDTVESSLVNAMQRNTITRNISTLKQTS